MTYSEIFWEYRFQQGILGRSPKGHNCDLWRIIFSYKHVWITRIGIIYYGKCNCYVLIKCIRHCVKGELIHNYFKTFNFLLIWDKNLGSQTSWPVAKPLWIIPHKWFEYHTLLFKLDGTSRRVLVLLEWCGSPKKIHIQSFFKHFPCKCFAKTKGDSLQILWKQFFFSADANVFP